ncbi:hypothetical protein [Microbaculum marinum]|uniref:Uncharacterized protein n=1 Tax=Microbaculum marinum TaxID=1764581 RepID=A0AAW9S4A6_9HYPH
MSVFLIHFDRRGADETGLRERFMPFELQPGLYMAESDETLSKVYHAAKRHLAADAWLFVAPLDRQPKFKGMADGALKWARSRFR